MEMLKWVQFKVPTPVSMRILLKYPKSSDILNKFPSSMKCILIQIYPQSSAHRFFWHSDKFGVTRFEQFRKTPWLACVFNYMNMLFHQHDVWYTPTKNWNPLESYVLSAMSASTPLWPCRWVRRLKKKELNICVLSRSLSLSTSRKRYLKNKHILVITWTVIQFTVVLMILVGIN